MHASGWIRIEPGRSPRLAAALIAMHLGAAVAAAFAEVPVGVRVAAAALLIGGLVRALREHVLHLDDAVVAVAAGGRDEWRVTTRRAPECGAALGRELLVLPWLAILNFHLDDGRRRTVILTADNAPAGDLRRLRVRARHP
ncbi:MAG: protein YgfX [Gammaproteobacteria bacterium]